MQVRIICERTRANEDATIYNKHSPGGYSMQSAFISEVVMTFAFLVVVLGATHSKAPKGFAGIAIGLALTLIHLISIPSLIHL